MNCGANPHTSGKFQLHILIGTLSIICTSEQALVAPAKSGPPPYFVVNVVWAFSTGSSESTQSFILAVMELNVLQLSHFYSD